MPARARCQHDRTSRHSSAGTRYTSAHARPYKLAGSGGRPPPVVVSDGASFSRAEDIWERPYAMLFSFERIELLEDIGARQDGAEIARGGQASSASPYIGTNGAKHFDDGGGRDGSDVRQQFLALISGRRARLPSFRRVTQNSQLPGLFCELDGLNGREFARMFSFNSSEFVSPVPVRHMDLIFVYKMEGFYTTLRNFIACSIGFPART